jgi:hypothetical protein
VREVLRYSTTEHLDSNASSFLICRAAEPKLIAPTARVPSGNLFSTGPRTSAWFLLIGNGAPAHQAGGLSFRSRLLPTNSFLEIVNLRIEVGFRSEPYIYCTFVDPSAPNCTWALDLVEEECLPKKQALIPTRNPLQSCGCMWACSSAGRAPALQESRQNHTSAASGVAYADSRGATTLLNWTEVGPNC